MSKCGLGTCGCHDRLLARLESRRRRAESRGLRFAIDGATRSIAKARRAELKYTRELAREGQGLRANVKESIKRCRELAQMPEARSNVKAACEATVRKYEQILVDKEKEWQAEDRVRVAMHRALLAVGGRDADAVLELVKALAGIVPVYGTYIGLLQALNEVLDRRNKNDLAADRVLLEYDEMLAICEAWRDHMINWRRVSRVVQIWI